MKVKFFMSTVIFIFFVLSIDLVRSERVLILMFTIDKDDKISIESVDYYNTDKILPKNGDYRIDVLDENNNVLYSKSFDVKFLILSDPPTEVNETSIYVRLPWQDKFSKVSFYHLDKLIHTINLSNYLCNNDNKCELERGESLFLCPDDCSMTSVTSITEIITTTITGVTTTTTMGICNNNNKCEPRIGENYNNCPEDCRSGLRDNYCDKVPDDICDPDCKEKEDIDCRKTNMLWVYIIIGLVIIVLLVLFLTKIRGGGIERRR